MSNERKPPLGIMPREVWQDKVNTQRAADLSAAMLRYADSRLEIPLAWFLELSALLNPEVK